MRQILLLVTLFLSLSSLAGASNHSGSDAVKFELIKNLASAQSESEGREAEGHLWQFWFNQAPTAEVRKLFDAGQERLRAYDYEAAESYLDQVVEAAPQYAEGYNQRAFARFLRGKYTESGTDLEKALELEPHHFGAMSGMYQILRIQNRHTAAMNFLQQAVTLHPWIKERGALPRDMWPDSYRELHEPGLEI